MGRLVVRVVENDGFRPAFIPARGRTDCETTCRREKFAAAKDPRQWALALYGRPEPCQSMVEWVSGQGFFNTEQARGPPGATERGTRRSLHPGMARGGSPDDRRSS